MGSPIRNLLSYFLVLAYLATLSIAQSTQSVDTPTPTSSAAAQTHTISVGNGDHKFRPDVTQAEIGDVNRLFPPYLLHVNKAVDHRVSILSA
jgi:hypothetical protein